MRFLHSFFDHTMSQDSPQQPVSNHDPDPAAAVPDSDADKADAQNNLDVLIHAISSHVPRSNGVGDDYPSRPVSPGTAERSIQSLLAASQQLASPPQGASEDNQSAGAKSNGKRKADDAGHPDESRNKIRRTVRDHIMMDYSRVMSMTTVVCLHAAVAQKSYGSEKRFLCPPPVVRVEGPFRQMRRQQLSMCIVAENGERSPEQKAPLDDQMSASFKFLHVAGTAKSKSFHLSLDIADPVATTGSAEHPEPRPPWASFDSAPVTIISKPSKKTAKTRNISSCILAGGPVSLFNRINSQTVRTKYMSVDNGSLSASSTVWSAFNVNVLRRPIEPDPSLAARIQQQQLIGPQPVTYGSEIVLVDPQTAVSSGPLIIRKVDKGKVVPEDGGPVSQMQKIALQRINPDGSRYYLSAAMLQQPGSSVSDPGPSANGGGGLGDRGVGQSSGGGPHALHFQPPRLREDMREGVRIVVDEVDDYLCWTIVGISKFQYTFFDAMGDTVTPPSAPITPFPTLCSSPVYRATSNTVELSVTNFFYLDPQTNTHLPLEIWLGSMGPLRQRIYNAAPPIMPPPPHAPSGPAHAGPAGPGAAAGPNGQQMPPPALPMPVFPPGPVPTIVVVEMPPLGDIVRTLQDTFSTPLFSARADGPRNTADKTDATRTTPPQANGSGVASPAAGPATAPPPPGTDDDAGRAAAIASALTAAAAAASAAQAASPNAAASSAPQTAFPSPEHPDSTLPIIASRGLPLLFIRPSDGTGYHSGRSIACENIFQSMSMQALSGLGHSSSATVGTGVDQGWLEAAQAAVAAEGGMHGWTLRVL